MGARGEMIKVSLANEGVASDVAGAVAGDGYIIIYGRASGLLYSYIQGAYYSMAYLVYIYNSI